MEIYLYLILFLAVIVSGSSVFLLKKIDDIMIKLLLAFSGAYLFSISVLNLIPEIYSAIDKKIGIYILAGFFLQILLEYFSKGIEHGHIHHQKNSPFPYAILLSLCIHSFLEGMPLASGKNSTLYVGIVLHNIPISIVLTTMLLQTQMSKIKVMSWLTLFALMLPFGSIFSLLVGEHLFLLNPDSQSVILAFVVGIFLHISTTILFESTENHKFNAMKLVTILIGTACALFSVHP